jgi:hypothetical protein
MTVSDEEKKSTIDAIPKELPYAVEPAQPNKSDSAKHVETNEAKEKEAPAALAAAAAPAAPVPQRVR